MGIFCQLCFLIVWLFGPWSEVLRFNDCQITYPYPEMYKYIYRYTSGKISCMSFTFLFYSSLLWNVYVKGSFFIKCLCHWNSKETFLLYVGNYYCFPRDWTVVANISHASSKLPFPSIMTCHYRGSIFSSQRHCILYVFSRHLLKKS